MHLFDFLHHRVASIFQFTAPFLQDAQFLLSLANGAIRALDSHLLSGAGLLNRGQSSAEEFGLGRFEFAPPDLHLLFPIRKLVVLQPLPGAADFGNDFLKRRPRFREKKDEHGTELLDGINRSDFGLLVSHG